MKSRDLVERSRQAVWHPCTQMKAHERFPPVPVERAAGVWLYDFDGRRYLDAVGSWWVNILGHAHPRINAAVRDQLERLEHVMLAGFTHAPVVELSERLSALTSSLSNERLGRCFYASDGASAVEIALKMSFHYWRNSGRPEKQSFVALSGGYHGETLGALSVTDVLLFRDAYAPLLRRSATVPSPDWRAAERGESPAEYAIRRASDLERFLEEKHGETAALILEPLVQCAAGMAMYHPEYLRRAKRLCERYEVHLIADEIAVGCGRSGTFLACEQGPVRPDFLCLSKGLSGGYLPLSVVLTTEAVYGAFYDDEIARGFLHSHSYTGNPLACRAALAALSVLEDDRVLQSNRGKASLFLEKGKKIASHPRVRHWRNTGMIWAFDVETNDPAFARRFHAAALERELLLRPLGRTVYFMPPYVIEPGEIDLLVDRTVALLDELE
ncbi:MAG TPA: adenosylmethionine--8-amino-7-oxononanoate transaminase [Burkholderiales bacterium]